MTELGLEAAIVDLIKRDAIPIAPYPAVALKIAALLRRTDYGLQDLAKLVSSDQSLAARVLRVAEPPMFGGSGPVSSIQGAVARLGAREVSSLALASQLGAQAQTSGPLASLRRRSWQESTTSALLCQKLGAARGQPPEDAFTCGLLHDFGRLVVTAALEQVLAAKPKVQEESEAYWNRLVDKFHVEFGQTLAKRWKLSRLLCDVMTLHHGATTTGCENPVLLDTVMAADQVIAIANDLPGVSADDLSRATRLRSRSERDLVVLILPLCPSIVATFEAYEPQPVQTPSAVAVARTTVPLKPLALDASCANSPGVHYRATGIGPNLLVLEGPAPLLTNRLVLVTLQLEGRQITLWMNTQSSEAKGRSHQVELRPVGLSGESAQAWADLRRP